MRYIVDTHVLLWWLMDDSKLDSKKKNILMSDASIVFVSAVSAWEIEIKRSLGKLKIPSNFYEAIKASAFIEMPIKIIHTLKLRDLDMHHGDPFDRLLVAQCLVEKCVLLTSDSILNKYPITTE